MKSEDFCRWLQGCLELNDSINQEQLQKIKTKLDEVFEDPSYKVKPNYWSSSHGPLTSRTVQ
jgi:hypothetical protein